MSKKKQQRICEYCKGAIVDGEPVVLVNVLALDKEAITVLRKGGQIPVDFDANKNRKVKGFLIEMQKER